MQTRTLAGALVICGSALAMSATLQAQDAPDQAATQQPTAAAGAAGAGVAEQKSEVAAQVPENIPETAGASRVRIVRLSQVRGAVQLDRNTGRGYEPAFANIPVIAGARLRTGQGVAEVEFEDNSSLRLTPDSEVVFRQLSRSAVGATETTVQVARGVVYVSLVKSKDAQFVLVDQGARIEPQPGTHLRLDASKPEVELAVFDGTAQLQVGSSVTTLTKKQTVQLMPATLAVASIQKGTEEGDWDEWDKQASGYHKQVASLAGSNGGLGLYGANDLNYYGSFVDMPGCGSMWRPYFATAAWDPFANGVWTYYPTAGYSWVSPYPWGWLPFHSGSWASCGAAGWGWRPSNSWYGLRNVDALRIAKHPLPHPVPTAPARNAASFVPVNTRPLVTSGLMQGQRFTFQRDSAGLGVPRSSFGSLHGFANHVDRQGTATVGVPERAMVAMPVHGPTGAPGTSGFRPGNTMGAVHGGSVTSSHGSAGVSSARSSSMSMGSAMHGGGMSAPSAAPSGGGAAHK